MQPLRSHRRARRFPRRFACIAMRDAKQTHCNGQMVNECGGGWESRVRLQHVLALSAVVVVRRGSLLFLRFIILLYFLRIAFAR